MASSVVAAILATVDHHGHYHGSPSVTSTVLRPTSAGVTSSTMVSPVAVPEVVVAARRASDGGSILSSAAAAVSTSLAAARNPFSSSNHRNHHQYHPRLHHTEDAYPPLPHPSTLPRRMIKVTLHQQQGANSTLRAIYEKLQVVWDQQTLEFEQQQQQAASCSTISTTITNGGGAGLRAIAAPTPIIQKALRGPAI
ncbi:hypothetical protein BG015_003464 [Linnemannia schmuckeri]|uniref:Uncharacterized protein n=1 Tax=Linnemannia schmuckeri TaxID=64567 RepID=A0A9P5RK14_9FUNG|nr:hypothetical protein BG015_003464 [Linnemannia schmuckeri]